MSGPQVYLAIIWHELASIKITVLLRNSDWCAISINESYDSARPLEICMERTAIGSGNRKSILCYTTSLKYKFQQHFTT